VPTPRKSLAILCVAVVLLAALIPVATALAPVPLIQLAAVIVAESRITPSIGNSTPQPALRALVSSCHLARAALLPARS
jgi:hypothetical protein